MKKRISNKKEKNKIEKSYKLGTKYYNNINPTKKDQKQ